MVVKQGLIILLHLRILRSFSQSPVYLLIIIQKKSLCWETILKANGGQNFFYETCPWNSKRTRTKWLDECSFFFIHTPANHFIISKKWSNSKDNLALNSVLSVQKPSHCPQSWGSLKVSQVVKDNFYVVCWGGQSVTYHIQISNGFFCKFHNNK